MAIVKVTEKGQITLPVNLRRKLGITKDDYLLVVESDGEYVTLHKVSHAKALSAEDPIWEMIGQGASGKRDVAARHDYYLAKGERKRWRKS
jgi:transcriptional pleiotropic regulator of transition state genes